MDRHQWRAEVRRGAAQEFGRRHYRWYTAGRHAAALTLAAAALACVGATGWHLVHLPRGVWPRLLLTAAAVVAAALALWTVVDAATGARRRRRYQGRLSPVPVVAVLLIAALVAAAVITR